MADDSMTFLGRIGTAWGARIFCGNLMERVLEQLMDFGGRNGIQAGRHERSKPARPTGMGIGNDRCTRGWARPGVAGDRSCGKELFSVILETAPTRGTGTTAVIQEAWIGGMSTRKVDGLVQALGMTGITKSSVRLVRDIDERVCQSFRSGPLEGEWPYLWLDATYLKVRKGGRVVSVAAIIASGVNQDGRQEIRFGAGRPEAQVFWVDSCAACQRGLSGVQLIIFTDAHEGLEGRDQPSLYGAGNGAEYISCVTCWPACPRPASHSSVPWCAGSSSNPTRPAPRLLGGRSPINPPALSQSRRPDGSGRA